MTAPIAAPIAAPAPVAAPVAQAPVAAPVPVAAPSPATAPSPVAAPVSAPIAPAPAGIPVGYAGALSGPPAVASIPEASTGGISAEHFYKPLLFRILSTSSRYLKYEKVDGLVPLVDYIVLDPKTGSIEEVKGVTVLPKYLRTELVACYERGDRFVTGVAVEVSTSNEQPAKILKALDDQNSGYGAAQAREILVQAAGAHFHWWPVAA